MLASNDTQLKLYDEPPGGFKKRRLQNACDMCKKVKILSDSSKMPGFICSNCKAFNCECTHSSSNVKKKKTTLVNTISPTAAGEPASNNDPFTGSTLKLSGDTFTFAKRQISVILDTPSYHVPMDDHTFLLRLLTEIAAYARSLETALSDSSTRPSRSPSPVPTHSLNSSINPSHPKDPLSLYSEPSYQGHGTSPGSSSDNQDSIDLHLGLIDIELADNVKKLELDASRDSFFGGSSQLALMKTAIKIKEEYSTNSRNSNDLDGGAASIPHEGRKVDLEKKSLSPPSSINACNNPKKRPAFWNVHPWQHLATQTSLPELEFPPPSLLDSLVNYYFIKRNRMLPLLHRPTFQQGLDTHLHRRDRAFGELVLSVCAIGARYSRDERVYDGRASKNSEEREHSIGWKYINQIGSMEEFMPQSALYKVQTICNLIVFLSTTSMQRPIWALLAIGVRHAQAVGAHRRTFLGTKPSVKQELWKRAFWALVFLDSFTSAYLGRPKATDPAEYDLDLPIECDDEYWEHPDPDKAFKQPTGHPSSVVHWTTLLKLVDILAFAQRSLYSVKKPPELWSSSNSWASSWDQKVLVELDFALNIWVDNIPDHLRWDPHREDPLFFDQSCLLYSTYYFVQIHAHRPFIRPGTMSPWSPQEQRQRRSGISYPSLAVCANAARSCLHLLDLHSRRSGGASPISLSSTSSSDSTLSDPLPTPLTTFPVAIFNSAIMILMNLWTGKRLGMTVDPRRELQDVDRCLEMLRGYEKFQQNAGRLYDIINDLISVSSANSQRAEIKFQSVPSSGSISSRKRSRDTEVERGVLNQCAMFSDKAPLINLSSNPHATSSPEYQSSLRQPSVEAQQMRYSTLNSAPSSFSSPSFSLQTSLVHPPSSYCDNSIPISSVEHTAYLDHVLHGQHSLFGLPLHTEDLGRLPVLLGTDDQFSIQKPSINYNNFKSHSNSIPISTHSDEYYASNFDAGLGDQSSNVNDGVESLALETDFRNDQQWQTWCAQTAPSNQPPECHVRSQLQDPFVNMFNPTPTREGWYDWGMYMANVDELLRSVDSGYS
ncbi:hypothetical protein GYMLUDRAFT_34211 [Collybiopsis luxurians FD-317 M1]|nr:hypothetical protein GYMLUDRAFT_34211 [Collybiopsis luxurians FD-317 M1]